MTIIETKPMVLDVEQEFGRHLVELESVKYFLHEGVVDDLLNSPRVKAIYAFVKHHYNETGDVPSRAVLATEFEGFDFEEYESSAKWVVDRLRQRYKENEVQRLVRAIATMSKQPDQAMDYLRGQVFEIERNTRTSKNIWKPGDQDRFFEIILDKIEQGHYKGISTGFDQVDKFTGGLRPGYLAGLAARPKRQKTFFLLMAFIEQVLAGNRPILFTLENTEEEIMLRISCLISQFPWDRAHRGDFMPNDWKMIRNAWDQFCSFGDFTIARPNIGERTVPALLLEADKQEAESILISQFKYIEPTQWYPKDHERWGSIVVDLKLGATRSGSERPVYVETQLNREAQSMQEMMDADLSQIGLTDMWGQACDIMFCLYQNQDLRASQLTEFGIIEARNSDKHSWKVFSEFREHTELRIVG